jgi:hypothetical protein
VIHIRRGMAAAESVAAGTRQFREPRHPSIPTLTRVSLVFMPARINVYLRFGHASQQRLLTGLQTRVNLGVGADLRDRHRRAPYRRWRGQAGC